MPYKDINKQRACQNEWIKNRRKEWVLANGPCQDCGATTNLQVTFKKIEARTTHRIWSWKAEKREAVLNNCIVCCRQCSDRRRSAFYGWGKHGETRYKAGCRCEICRVEHNRTNRRQKFRAKILKDLSRGGAAVEVRDSQHL